eukprot:GCRY01006129.1.p1 GENE.GCRY01006129.1~~GCRY01006129.1.p1  ORF type:complete len:408 (-),score=78.36 GCRY01006129.1:11-1234(-)
MVFELEEHSGTLLQRVQHALRSQLSKGYFGEKLLQSQAQSLFNLLENTISFSENASVVIVGSQGSGKKGLIKNVLSKLNSKYDDQFLTVTLNGLIHTSDHQALQDIARQFCLQHKMEGNSFGSFADCLQFLLELLSGTKNHNKAVVFVLEHFDLFALHPNQTLLYNLLDYLQHSETKMAVVGTTTRMDYLQLLEKRVKSRFSQRDIFVHAFNSFEDYLSFVEESLILPDDSTVFPSAVELDAFNTALKAALSSMAVVQTLTDLFNFTHDLRTLRSFLLYVILAMKWTDDGTPVLTESCFTTAYQQLSVDGKVTLLRDLSVLELSLLVALMKIEKRNFAAVTFEMMYDEYHRFASSGMITPSAKEITMKAFERLLSLELIVPLKGRSPHHRGPERSSGPILHALVPVA